MPSRHLRSLGLPPSSGRVPAAALMAPRHVLRVTSVFEPPDAALAERGVRFDPIGGMQNHTAQLTRALDARGVRQTVVTTRPPGAPEREWLGYRATVHRHGMPVPFARQLYGLPAALAERGVRFDPIGGMQNHTAQLTRALDARGVRQTVVTTRPPGAPERDRLGHRATVLRHGMPIPLARQLYGPPAARTAARIATSGGVDLVHAHVGEDLVALPIAARAARRAGAPLVVTVHTSLAHTFAVDGLRSRLLKSAGGRIEAWGCDRAAAVVVLTPRLAQRLADGGVPAELIHVIPSGVVPADFASVAPDPFPEVRRPRILFLGRLHRQKGVDTLVEAVARMQSRAEVVLVGDGPERGRLEAAVATAGLGDRIRFAGFRPHREVAAILAHADVFAMPSVYEELGTALIEAMAAGLPIVASDTGGIPGAAGGAARLVPPGDPSALAAALDGLLEHPVEAARLGALARERATGFDWNSLADQVLDVYSHALRGDVGGRATPAAPAYAPARA